MTKPIYVSNICGDGSETGTNGPTRLVTLSMKQFMVEAL